MTADMAIDILFAIYFIYLQDLSLGRTSKYFG